MPGVVMNGGTIEVQGETVGKVLVDGEPFFGDDPAMAMQNIPVAIIDRIEFLDQKSDQAILTGFDDGQTIKTINIITKRKFGAANLESSMQATELMTTIFWVEILTFSQAREDLRSLD